MLSLSLSLCVCIVILDASATSSGVTLTAPPQSRHFSLDVNGRLTASGIRFKGGAVSGSTAVRTQQRDSNTHNISIYTYINIHLYIYSHF